VIATAEGAEGSEGAEDLTLALDASTYHGSVALLRGTNVIAERTVEMRATRGDRLMPAVSEVLGDAGVAPRVLDCIVCGGGPGSFTSLRVAASVAKGIAAGSGVPLFAVPSLALLVAASPHTKVHGFYIAALNAMRGDAFVGMYEIGDAGICEKEPARLVPGEEIDRIAVTLNARVIGPGREIDAHPHARGVARLVAQGGVAKRVSLAEWEPDYGRASEAQVRWEAAHGRALGSD
jgi:tRNA threonylcarbamoyladenosine biosynthesis protein TsaB